MNELERFWIWAIDEKPTTERFLELCGKRLSEQQRDDLREAAELMAFRLDASSDYVDAEVKACFERHPIAFRDLSLALHTALNRMREQVPEGTKADAGPPPDHMADAAAYALQAQMRYAEMVAQPGRLLVAGAPFRREYLGEWLIADEGGVLREQALGIDARKREREEKRDRMAEMYESLPIGAVPVERKTPEQLCEMYPERGDR